MIITGAVRVAVWGLGIENLEMFLNFMPATTVSTIGRCYQQ